MMTPEQIYEVWVPEASRVGAPRRSDPAGAGNSGGSGTGRYPAADIARPTHTPAYAGRSRTSAAPGPPDFAIVDIWPIVHALAAATEFLKARTLPWAAPPAFLLDANRRGMGVAVLPGWFDNRSISFPTDFPGSQFLFSHGIRRVILVQEDRLQPQPDLAHTLRGWQGDGIEIQSLALSTSDPPRLIRVERPRFYRWVWHRLLTGIGLRRNPLGGFGGMLSEASAG